MALWRALLPLVFDKPDVIFHSLGDRFCRSIWKKKGEPVKTFVRETLLKNKQTEKTTLEIDWTDHLSVKFAD